MSEEISMKNTKSEILSTYNKLLKSIKEEKSTDRKELKKRDEEKKIVMKSEEIAVESIIQGLADARLNIGKAFEKIEENLISRQKQLSDLKKAIEIETKRIEEIHQVSVEADSLAALISAQKEQKAIFKKEYEEQVEQLNAEIAEKKAVWQKERQSVEMELKERKGVLEKERKHEEEDYMYTLKRKREKENDEYEAKKAALEKEMLEKKESFEKEFALRKVDIDNKEKEYEELKKKVEEFPKTLEKAVEEAKKTETDRIETQYKHEAELLKNGIEGERKLLAQKIQLLEMKLKEKDTLVTELTQKASDAEKRAQDVALKAIEGASRPQITREIYEKVKDKDMK